MWNLHAVFRFGDYTTREIDLTPALGVSAVALVFMLILQTA